MVAKKPENMSFETAVNELEQTVSQLEQGEIELEEALRLFERGINLVRACQGKLAEAEQKVQILNSDQQLAPFSFNGEQ